MHNFFSRQGICIDFISGRVLCIEAQFLFQVEFMLRIYSRQGFGIEFIRGRVKVLNLFHARFRCRINSKQGLCIEFSIEGLGKGRVKV